MTHTFMVAARKHDQLHNGRKRFPRHLQCLAGDAASEEKGRFKLLTRQGLQSLHVGQADLAEQLFEQALSLAEGIYGLAHHRTAVATLMLAKACRLNGKSAEAALLSDHAKTMFEHGQRTPAAGGSSGFWSLLAL